MKIPPFFRFIIVGTIGLIINESVLILLKGYFGVPLVLASIIAPECSILFQFQANDRWTFCGADCPKSKWTRFGIYQTTCIVAVIINWVVLNGLVTFTGIDYRIANILGIFVAFFWNVFINFKVTWKT